LLLSLLKVTLKRLAELVAVSPCVRDELAQIGVDVLGGLTDIAAAAAAQLRKRLLCRVEGRSETLERRRLFERSA
jgi:hypothetical protein